MKNLFTFALIIFFPIIFLSCKEKNAGKEDAIPSIVVKTTAFTRGDIEKYVNLNGKTIYLKKNQIVAPISAYVAKVNVQYGDVVQKDDVLFELQTKENKALNTAANNIKVLASSGGTIIELTINQTGAYLVEGDLLCIIAENNDVMVQVNVPYEYNSLLKTGAICKLLLPDHTSISSKIARILPSVSETDQTQTVLLKPDTRRQLPENLNLTVQFILVIHRNSLLIPKEALLTNENQSNFWLMKIAHDSIAIRVPVQKGIENDSVVEIISTGVNIHDLIISEGAYGLPDSSVVKISK